VQNIGEKSLKEEFVGIWEESDSCTLRIHCGRD